jgi:hypothetical protein
MALHDNVKNRAFDFKGIYIFLAARRVKNNDFSQKSDEDGLRQEKSVLPITKLFV